MANSNSSNKNKSELVSSVIFSGLTSPTVPTDVIPSGFAGIVADSSGVLQSVAADGTVSSLGENLLSVTAGEALSAGNWVYIKNSDGKAYKAKADASTTAPAVGVVNAAALLGASCLIQTEGFFASTSLTTGSTYYLSAATGGAMTTTAPTATGQLIQVLGVATSATKLEMRVGGRAVTTDLNVPAFLLAGTGSVLTSGTTVAPTNFIHHVSGTSAIVNITVPAAMTAGGQIVLIPDAIFTMTNAGNIAIAVTAVVNKALIMTYDGTKWNPSYLS